VEVVDVDYNSPESISAALQGIEVIISTIGTDAISTQTKVIDVAAEIESVRLFVPSEFGLGDYLDPELVKVSEVVRHKDLTRKYLESVSRLQLHLWDTFLLKVLYYDPL
jgi:hypothetical protein